MQNSNNYHHFPLTESALTVIDSKDSYYEFLSEIDSNGFELEKNEDKMLSVGIDAEWTRNGRSLNLLQIALHDQIFLLDIQVLSKSLLGEDWTLGLGKRFLVNPKICKIGFQVSTDLWMLRKTIPYLRSSTKNPKNVIDLIEVMDKLWLRMPEIICVNDHISDLLRFEGVHRKGRLGSYHLGLSTLVRLLLGKPLNKEEQCSEWDVRPLTLAQKLYAAQDAFCLLQIMAELEKRIKQHKVYEEEIARDGCVLTWLLINTNGKVDRKVDWKEVDDLFINHDQDDGDDLTYF